MKTKTLHLHQCSQNKMLLIIFHQMFSVGNSYWKSISTDEDAIGHRKFSNEVNVNELYKDL